MPSASASKPFVGGGLISSSAIADDYASQDPAVVATELFDAANVVAATYADVAGHMLTIAEADGNGAYLDYIRNSFTVREVLKANAMTEDGQMSFAADIVDGDGAVQDRRACCGTMNHAEYSESDQLLEAEREALATWCRSYGAR